MSRTTPQLPLPPLKGVPLQCCFCNQHHLSERCQVVRGPEERKRVFVSQKNRPLFSLSGRGHLSRQCRSRSRCSGCNGRHHRSICGELADENLKGLGLKDVSPSGKSCDSKSSPSAKLNPEAVPFPQPSTSLLVGARGGSAVTNSHCTRL